VTNDLLLAILSMDAYNRGSNPGLRVDASSIGGATVGTAQGGAGPVSISVDELINQAGISAFAFRFSFEQRGYFGSSDYGARTYIYNTKDFYLSQFDNLPTLSGS
jgi:hypothetical protein